MAATMQEYREKMSWVYTFLGGCCVVCGKKKSLHVHHLKNKSFNVSSHWGWKKETLKKELKKCELRCATCHRALHTRPHGTEARYRHSACRCAACREAHRIRHIIYRKGRYEREPNWRRSRR
jgi:hypothetical protein